MASGGVVRAVHPVAIAMPRLDVGDEGMPDETVDLGQRESSLDTVGVEQAQFDALSSLAEQREVRARAVVGRTQRVGLSRPDLKLGGDLLIGGSSQGCGSKGR